MVEQSTVQPFFHPVHTCTFDNNLNIICESCSVCKMSGGHCLNFSGMTSLNFLLKICRTYVGEQRIDTI